MTVTTKRKPLKPFWLFPLLYLSTTALLLAQQNRTYSGELQLGEYRGKANFTYQVVGIDTVYNGHFTLANSSLEALLKENDSSFSIAGNFESGVPNGNWVFQFGEFYTDSTTQVTGFQYQVNINGTQAEAIGNLSEGKPNGKWRFSKKRIQDSRVKDTLFFSEVSFNEGVPQQNFRIENAKATLVGRFLRDGKAHDTWSLFSDEDGRTENWYFDNGRLVKIESTFDGRVEERPIYGATMGNTKVVSLDKGYLKLIFLNVAELTDDEKNPTSVHNLLLENIENYNKIDGILSNLGSSGFSENFKVEVPYYPLDSVALKKLKTAISLIENGKETCDAFLNSTQLNLLKRSDEEANYLYNVLRAIEMGYIKPLQKVTELNALGITEYMSREDLMKYLFPNGVPSKIISVTPENGEVFPNYEAPNSSAYDFTGNTIEGLFQITAYANFCLESVFQKLNTKLSKNKKEQEFIALEERMIRVANELNKTPDSLMDKLGNKEKKALESIQTLSEKLLSDYAEMESGDEKLAQAKSLVSCMDSLKQLSKEIETLPVKLAELQRTYKDAVWNPFTATIMDEMVKKRITAAHKNVLLPYVLEKTITSLTCGNVPELQELLRQLQERMLELRDEDTSKLERKLRKEQNPLVVLELFNLKPLDN